MNDIVNRVYRQQGDLTIVRSALGQSIEYDVYRASGDNRVYLGGGSKRQATAIFNRALKVQS